MCYYLFNMKNNEELVERALKEGHEIADELSKVRSESDLDKLSDRIEKFYEFVDENFGVVDEFDENSEKYSELSFYLLMAIEAKERSFPYYHPEIEDYGNSGVRDFEYYLDSREWLIENADKK